MCVKVPWSTRGGQRTLRSSLLLWSLGTKFRPQARGEVLLPNEPSYYRLLEIPPIHFLISVWLGSCHSACVKGQDNSRSCFIPFSMGVL